MGPVLSFDTSFPLSLIINFYWKIKCLNSYENSSARIYYTKNGNFSTFKSLNSPTEKYKFDSL